MFIISFFFLLLGRSETMFAQSSTIVKLSFAQFHEKNNQNDSTTENQNLTVIEDNDLDVEEDYHNVDNVKLQNNNSNTNLGLHEAKYSNLFKDIVSANKTKQFKESLNRKNGNATPIYILYQSFLI